MERALHGVEVPHFHNGELIHTSRRFDERLTVALLAMRDQLGPRRPLSTHPSFAFGPDDFGALVERVERGPDTFDEEARAARERYYEEYEEEDYDEEEDEEEEEDTEEGQPEDDALFGTVSTSEKEHFSYDKLDFRNYRNG